MVILKGALYATVGLFICYAAHHYICEEEVLGKTGKEVAEKTKEVLKDGADTVLEEIVKFPGRAKYFYEVTKDY
jgi:hypothetical protein